MAFSSERVQTALFLYRQLWRQRSWWLGHVAAVLMMVWSPLIATLLIMMGLPVVAMQKMPKHLPFSRRWLLGCSLLPSGVALALGLLWSLSMVQGQGVVSIWVMGSLHSPISYEAVHSEQRELSVAPSLWRVSATAPKAIVLPSGAKLALPSRRVASLGLYTYNPYWVSDDSGDEAISHQLSRTLSACCSLQLTEQQLLLHIKRPGDFNTVMNAAKVSRRGAVTSLLWRYWWLVFGLVWAIRLNLQASAKDEKSWFKEASFAQNFKLIVVVSGIGSIVGFTMVSSFNPVSSEPWLASVLFEQLLVLPQSRPWACIGGAALLLAWGTRALFRSVDVQRNGNQNRSLALS